MCEISFGNSTIRYKLDNNLVDYDFNQLERITSEYNSWIWNKHEKTIENLECYSKELLLEIQRRFNAAKEYLAESGETLGTVSTKYNLTRNQVKNFTNDLLGNIPLTEIAKRQLGYKGSFGLLFAQAELQIFKLKFKKKPNVRDEGMTGILSAISRGEWVSFGIKSWNNLLRKTFGEINLKRDKYIGEEGLRIAILELKEFERKNKRLPRNRKIGLLGVAGAVYNGSWTDFGVKSWNDLLHKTFGKINTKMNVYIDKQGLKVAKKKLESFYSDHKRIPTISDPGMKGIVTAIRRKEWALNNIDTWSDLLLDVFGRLNIEYGAYRGEKGLRRAINEVQEFFKTNGRMPTCKDKNMQKIATAISRGSIHDLGIDSWNSLLQKTFGKVNFRMRVYSGKKGLSLAIKELQDFYKKYKKFPRWNEENFGGIRAAINRKEWIRFDIYNWKDLLSKTFENTYIEASKNPASNKTKYLGEQGLKQAIKELMVFREEKGRMPRARDKEVATFLNIIRNGLWVRNGVFRWNDLLYKAFERVNQRKNIYTGEQGLLRAIEELKKFNKTHDRLPTASDKGLGGILRAVKRGEWSDMNINKWNDLLDKTFGQINLQRNKYDGKQGLVRAKEELVDFYTKTKRLPKYRDREVRGIIGAIQTAKWIDLGINGWSDLLMSTFRKTNLKR